MYLLADNQLAGVITLRYLPTKHTYKAMRLMRRMHMNAVIAARDFNVSPAMVEEEFDLRRGFADQPDPAGVARLLDPRYAKGDAPAAVLTREGAGPFMQVLRCADKLAGAVRSALTLSTFAGLFGMLIVFYLVFQNQAAALPYSICCCTCSSGTFRYLSSISRRTEYSKASNSGSEPFFFTLSRGYISADTAVRR